MTPARDVSLTGGDQKLGIVKVLPLDPATGTFSVGARRPRSAALSRGRVQPGRAGAFVLGVG